MPTAHDAGVHDVGGTVNDDRWTRLAGLLAESVESTGVPLDVGACRVAAGVLEVDRTALSLVVGDSASPIGGSDHLARDLDEQQFLVGDGPTVSCVRSDSPVLIDDVRTCLLERPGFATAAIDHGVLAAFAFPLRIGAARVGVLTGYRDRPGALTGEQFADGLVLASIVTVLLLVQQAEEPPGSTARVFREGVETQSLVQRAAGMVSEQLGVSIVDALVVIRSHAYTNGFDVRSVAERVLSRDLILGDEEQT
jgi:hypothetical protein